MGEIWGRYVEVRGDIHGDGARFLWLGVGLGVLLGLGLGLRLGFRAPIPSPNPSLHEPRAELYEDIGDEAGVHEVRRHLVRGDAAEILGRYGGHIGEIGGDNRL